MKPALVAHVRHWPLRRPFAISRQTFTENIVLEVHVMHSGATGRGESEPHEYDVSVTEAAAQALQALDRDRWEHLDPPSMNGLVSRSALRNALDCALWDLRAKRTGRRVWEILGLDIRSDARFPIVQTLGLDTPERMATAARTARAAPGLKIKLGHPDGRDTERLEAIRAAVPGLLLTIDANEGWSPEYLRGMLPLAARHDVAFIEQPLPATMDAALAEMPRYVPFCADESCLDRRSLPDIVGRYQMINIKLDKTGGLTEALALVDAARELGLKYMVGCNAGSSLAQAPAVLLASDALMVDLGVDELAADQAVPLDCSSYFVRMPSPLLWG